MVWWLVVSHRDIREEKGDIGVNDWVDRVLLAMTVVVVTMVEGGMVGGLIESEKSMSGLIGCLCVNRVCINRMCP